MKIYPLHHGVSFHASISQQAHKLPNPDLVTINNNAWLFWLFWSGNWNENNINPLMRNNWRASLVPAAGVIPAPIAFLHVSPLKGKKIMKEGVDELAPLSYKNSHLHSLFNNRHTFCACTLLHHELQNRCQYLALTNIVRSKNLANSPPICLWRNKIWRIINQSIVRAPNRPITGIFNGVRNGAIASRGKCESEKHGMELFLPQLYGARIS